MTRSSGNRCAVIGVAILALAAAWPVQGGDGRAGRYDLADLESLERAFVELAARVRPSVVAIRTYELRAPGESDTRVRLPISHGSGFVIAADGYIATNKHVLNDADVISVVLPNGLRYQASVVQTDIRSDLAVLKIDAERLPVVRWGDLARVRVNQWAFACGNPFGLAVSSGDASVTYGVVSALGRDMTNRIEHVPGVHYYGNLIETSAAINPGGSGGPLFNLAGEVIGIVTAIETSSGVSEGTGFAIPVDRHTRRILDTLTAGKQVRYGFLGVTVADVEQPTSRRVADTGHHRGAKIEAVNPGTPAAAAALEPGDVLIEFDGIGIDNMDHLIRLVGFTQVGTDVVLTYLRRQVKRKVTVTVGDRFELLGATPGR